MRECYLGDSYDLVKRTLLRWLQPLGDWGIHPMFTEAASDAFISSYTALMGIPLVSTEVLTRSSNRAAYFAPCSRSTHCFLDPNTGLKIQAGRGPVSTNHLFGSDLETIVGSRLGIAVVFDQSLSFARNADDQLQEKLAYLGGLGLFGFAYRSHACFLFISRDRQLLGRARELLTSNGRLPSARLVPKELLPEG